MIIYMKENNKENFEGQTKRVINALCKDIEFEDISSKNTVLLENEKNKFKNEANSVFIPSFSDFEKQTQENFNANKTRE